MAARRSSRDADYTLGGVEALQRVEFLMADAGTQRKRGIQRSRAEWVLIHLVVTAVFKGCRPSLGYTPALKHIVLPIQGFLFIVKETNCQHR
jgi:hypothetical protein